MEVRVAKTAGFCFGVKRAVDMVYEQIQKHEGDGTPIYTYGPIIHNQEVVKDLQNKGVVVVHTEEELSTLTEGIVIIRSHGVQRSVYELLEMQGLTIIDATCPFVRKIHEIVQEEEEKGYRIVIIGDSKHPEVQGILGWVRHGGYAIQSRDEAEHLPVSTAEKLCVVTQTTFNYIKFKELVEILEKKGYDIFVLNTICNATKERQEEALEIAEQVDAMIVIGDKHSSNTQKLYEISQKACKSTYYIQTLDDMIHELPQLVSMETVGITAGASTPNTIIEEVQKHVRDIF